MAEVPGRWTDESLPLHVRQDLLRRDIELHGRRATDTPETARKGERPA